MFSSLLILLLICFDVVESQWASPADEPCKCKEAALGMATGVITDGQISASSQWDVNHAAIQGRLHFKAGGGKQGAWSARTNDVNQWLQVDLGSRYTRVTRVATQGRNAVNQWVTKYKLQYSNDGLHFQYYREQGQSKVKEFAGNADQDTVVDHELNPPIKARYIRFQPVTWHSHISMRVELYGCEACQDHLGMESGAITDGQIRASSEWDVNHAAIQGRLNFKAGGGKAGGWSARTNDANQWLQVDLGSRYTRVTCVATQGRNIWSQWVTKYKLQYSNDGVNFQYYREQGKTAIKEFAGNWDQDTIVYHGLNPPIKARYIRFQPVAWHGHISMRVELCGCKECKDALGMATGAISDEQITASSQWDVNHAAIQGRLHFEAGGGKQGAWSARTNHVNQWLQVDLGGYTRVTRVATQGRNAVNQWVTKYKLQYSNDGVNFQYYREQGQTTNKEFAGNADQDTVVYHQLNPPIKARYIRFVPVAWHVHISMRVELFGCEGCQVPLGMESGAISDGQIRASSQWDANHAAIQGRLHFQRTGRKQGAWSARRNDANQWIQVDLGGYSRVTHVATQGRNAVNQWVTKYKLLYSNNGARFQYYREEGQTAVKEFTGNADQDTVVYHELNPPINARYIRFQPVAWHGHISMRVELYGCETAEPNFQHGGGGSSECEETLGMETSAISNGQITASSQWDVNHAAIQGRLHFQRTGSKQGAWSARTNDVNQWLQVDLGNKNTKLTAVATQGRNAVNQWVTKYKLQYSNDGLHFQYYREQGQTVKKEFAGNTDQDTVVYHQLNPPIKARYIRFRPVAWRSHISMRAELYGCKECRRCYRAFGMENREISNGQITASSQWDANHAAIQGRLHFEAGGGKQGAWSARTNDVNQWLQVDLGSRYTRVTRVATQGRNAVNQWVTKYKLQYSNDGVNFQYYREQGKNENKDFLGNSNQDTVVYHQLQPPIKARYIRFLPVAWHVHISMRVELYGCQECQDALGMENDFITDGQISASSQWDANHAAIQGRLHFEAGGGKTGAWSAKTNDANQWLQVDMGCAGTAVTKVATQGRNAFAQWVTKYKLQYSKDGVTFQYYKEQGQTANKEFAGNSDQDTVISHQLNPPINARYIRFVPVTWHGHISMRVELFGCEDPDVLL
ncbi:hypothetical protein ACROYT_G026448 [Oculina patagonica]